MAADSAEVALIEGLLEPVSILDSAEIASIEAAEWCAETAVSDTSLD